MRLMRISDLEQANARMLAEAPKVRPVPTSEIVKVHRRRFPYRGWVEVDSPYCPPYVVFCNNDDAVALDTVWNGTFRYEPGSLRTWADLAAKSEVIVDVGAHVGHFALIAALAAPSAKVVAFEPVDYIYARLSVNQRANGLKNLEALPTAVSDHEGWADISVRFGPSLLSTGSTLEPTDRPGTRIKKVPLTSIDAHFADTKVDLVKIDVEGHEPQVLNGAREVLKRDRPAVFIEVLRTTPLPALLEVLEPLGYQGSWVTEADASLRPLDAGRPPESRNVLFTAVVPGRAARAFGRFAPFRSSAG
jgi:FkbM family methyltransferase